MVSSTRIAKSVTCGGVLPVFAWEDERDLAELPEPRAGFNCPEGLEYFRLFETTP